MQRLLLVTPNWFGDTLFATAVTRAVNERVPRLHLAVLCVPRSAEILCGNPRVNELIIYEERGKDRGPLAKWRLIRRLRAGAFDGALLLRPSLSRSCLLWCAGIPRRVGHAAPGKDWWLTDRVALPATPEHRADSYLRLLAAFGWTVSSDVSCEFFVSDNDRALVRQWLHAQGVMNDQRLVVLHPAGNWEHKRWPAERFAAVGDALRDAHGAQIVITGGEADRALAERVRAAMRTDAIVAAGETTLRQLGALVERADLIITNDSGPLHIAAALKRPFVALFGPTSPSLTGPYHPACGRVLHHPDCCPTIPCYAPNRPPHAGMLSLTVDEVVEAADALLKKTAVPAGVLRHE